MDLYLIHFPIALKYVDFEERYPPGWIHDPKAKVPCLEEDKVPMMETWHAMEELVREGLVRSIGVSNCNVSILRDILSYCKIKPVLNEVEMHPYNTSQNLLKYCRLQGIAVTAYSNLGALSYVTIGLSTKQEICLEEDKIKDLAKKYKKTEAQIVLRWGLQRGTGIIPKTTREHILKENIDLFDFKLSSEEMKAIDSLDRGRKFNDPAEYTESAFKRFVPIFE